MNNQQFLKDLYKDDKQVALMSADKLFKYIKKNKPDKITLQEIKDF